MSEYTSRLLPPEEWDLLPSEVRDPLNPEYSYVVVVERDGKIVARWVALNSVHVEGLFVEPAHRGVSTVIKQLTSVMFDTLNAVGVTSIVTLIANPKVMELAEHAGFKQVLVDNGSGMLVPPMLFRLDRDGS